MNGQRTQKNAKGLSAADIAKLGPAYRERLSRELGGLESEKAKSKQKRWEVSWYSPWLKKRVKAGALIEAQNKGGAIAEVKASLGHRTFDKRQKLKPVNFSAVEVKRNPARPFFCADCDSELKSDAVMMGDGRVICPKCKDRAKQKRQTKSQRKLFDEQSELFQNGAVRLRNVEMGFVDQVGVFHPIRKSKDYNEFKTTDVASPAERKHRSEQHQRLRSEQWHAGEEKQRAKRFAKSHKSLSQFVRASGGINAPKGHDLSGELRQLGRHESGTTGLLNQRNRIGAHRFGPEHMMDAANTEGFRDRHGRPFDNIGNFLTAVADDAGGTRKLYSQEAQGSYYNPMAKKKKKAKGKVARAKKPMQCSRCRGAHHVSYCQAKSPTKNLFGLDRASRVKRHKKRARVSAAKASLLEAKDRLKRARKNPAKSSRQGAKAKKNGVLRSEQFGYEVNTKQRGRVAGLIKGRTLKSVAAAVRRAYKAAGIKSVRVWKVKAVANPMHPLEVVSHVAAGLSGAATAKKLFGGNRKKEGGGSKRPVGVRYYLYVGSQRRGSHFTSKPEAKAAARILANSSGATVTVRKLKGTATKPVLTFHPQRKRNGRQEAKAHVNVLQKNPSATGNTPALQKIHQDFLGRKNTGRTLRLYTPPGSPKHAGAMAKFTAVQVLKNTGKVHVQPFAKGSAWIGGVQNGDWRRMVIGLKQPFAVPNGLDPDKPYDYGEVVRIEYRARKPQLYGKDSPEYPFFHMMGEEGGKRPHLILQNGCLAFRGGGYGIKREGIRN
jgi:hypothetical protein